MLSTVDFFERQIAYESEYNTDGASTSTRYYYDGNNELYLIEIYERGIDGRTIKRIDAFYFQGALDYITENELNINGYISTAIIKHINGNTTEIINYTYNNVGHTLTVEVLFSHGSL